jgi:hypothetical protein
MSTVGEPAARRAQKKRQSVLQRLEQRGVDSAAIAAGRVDVDLHVPAGPPVYGTGCAKPPAAGGRITAN